MALFDVIRELCDAQTNFGGLTTSEGLVSEDIINLGDSDLNFGAGEPLYLNIRVNTAFTSGGSPATDITLYASTNATVNASDSEVYTLRTNVDLTGYSAGDYVFRGALPVKVDEEQYIGLYVQNATAEYTAGALDAWIGHGPQSDHDTQVASSNI